MKKFTPAEWQSFVTRKDIETITRKLKATSEVQSSLFIEVALIVFGVGFEKIFTKNGEAIWKYVCIASLLPVGYLFVTALCRKIRSKSAGRDRMNPKEFIDRFDNQICYYVLMSESYYSMLREAKDDMSLDKDIKRFYFIEASYYMNKAIIEMAPLYNIAESVLSGANVDIIGKRMISTARYNNLCNLLTSLQKYLSDHEDILDGLEGKEEIIELNEFHANQLVNIMSLSAALDVHTKDYIPL